MNLYAQVPSCSSLSDEKRRYLAHRLFELGALNFSGVRLKTGEVTPVYFDIRLTMSEPLLLQEITHSMYEMVSWRTSGHKFDLVTGVPAAAVALATSLSIQQNLPMILTRKAAKDHGTKKLIEGVWTRGQEVLVVEDVVTYGDSIVETIELLRSMGLVVHHALVVVERQQGATQNLLRNHDIHLHALLTFDEILNILQTDGLVSAERVEVARNFIASAQFNMRSKRLTDALSPMPRNLLGLKSINKCLSIDVPMSPHKILEIAEKEGGSIDALEITPQLVQYDFENFTSELVRIAESHGFLLIANCKLLGDESSARAALNERSYLSPSKWADIVTVCPLSPPEIFNAFRLLRKSSFLKSHLSVLLIAEFGLEEKCVEMAEKNPDVVLGFVSFKPLSDLVTSNGDYSSPSVIYQIPDLHCPLEKNGHTATNDHLITKDKFKDPSIGLLRTVYFSSMNGF
nr:uridine 5' monophosphate synthase [Hymenolepis microstoma]